MEELLAYLRRKLQMSRDFPRESRLFANEIVQGAPRIHDALNHDLKTLVDEKTKLLERWMDECKIARVHPYHLLFSVWSLTQHYADFDVQVRAVLASDDPHDGAEAHLISMFKRVLRP